jgi:uncharacterized protein Usg
MWLVAHDYHTRNSVFGLLRIPTVSIVTTASSLRHRPYGIVTTASSLRHRHYGIVTTASSLRHRHYGIVTTASSLQHRDNASAIFYHHYIFQPANCIERNLFLTTLINYTQLIKMADPTLIIVWVFTWIAVTVMSLRILLVKINKKPFSIGDYLTMGAIFCALTRLSLIHVVLIWGSNNVTPKFRAMHHFTPQEIYQREIGGKFTIVNRLFYNS